MTQIKTFAYTLSSGFVTSHVDHDQSLESNKIELKRLTVPTGWRLRNCLLTRRGEADFQTTEHKSIYWQGPLYYKSSHLILPIVSFNENMSTRLSLR